MTQCAVACVLLLQFGELPEQSAFGEEFCKSMSFFTRHSLTGGTTSLQVGPTGQVHSFMFHLWQKLI
jgi:hypothetical protein